MDYGTTFIANTRRILKEEKIKVSRFEAELGLKRGYLSRTQKHPKSLTLDIACEICLKLDRSLGELLTRKDV